MGEINGDDPGQPGNVNTRLMGTCFAWLIGSLRGVGGGGVGALMPIIRPNKGYLRKSSPLIPLPLTPLRLPMSGLSLS